MAIARTDRKSWARERFVGLQNVVAPSFNAELTALDEPGIRRDVRQSIRHGFFASLLACDAGLTPQENARFVEIAADEARDELLIGVSLFLDDAEQMRRLAEQAERAGASFALLGFPLLFNPRSEDEVYAFARGICDASNLAIVVPAHKERVDLGHLHPSGVPFALFDRLAAIPNVVAFQIGSIETGLISECFMRYRDRVLVSASFFGLAPLLGECWGQQWSGGAMYEALQSPERRLAVEMFDLVRRGRMEQAMQLYWQMAPGMAVLGQLNELFKPGATDNYQLRKYYQWCVGGNGGLTRQPHFNLFERQKQLIREAYRAMGIAPTPDGEQLFFDGRSRYSRA